MGKIYEPNLENEIWKIIEDSDGNFEISNCGRLKQNAHLHISKVGHKLHRKEEIKNQSFNSKNRYLYGSYRNKEGDSVNKSIHRLVALHFVENNNPNEFDQVNHIDATSDYYGKTNNCNWNLEWTNSKLNMEHASKNNLINKHSEKRKAQAPINARKGSYKNWVKIVEYDEDGKLSKIYDSISSVKMESENVGALKTRLSYNGKFYRSYDILMDKYGEIPNEINIEKVNVLRNKSRRLFYEYNNNELIKTYERLANLPISREDLWVSFNHEIPDIYGHTWDIKMSKGYKYKSENGRKIKLIKDDFSKDFISITDCAEWLKETVNPKVTLDSIQQYVQRKDFLYGYTILK